ncbi:MAG: allophanate hydrolase [Chthoniobacterales bacterium]
MKDLSGLSLTIASLQQGYRSGAFAPSDVIREVYQRVRAIRDNHIWIYLVPEEEAVNAADALFDASTAALYGIPFAIKDNIDAANLPTTAGCPAFSYSAAKNATVVQRLLEAGAILIGKTNLDQFATGLVGARSPYGACSTVFHPDYISGGSSSGSAVAVAAGLVTFALGTDTAGSGRVPAAFNNIVGLKPTRGLVSTHGVVPACRSLDCVTVFSLVAEDAETVFSIAASYDQYDPYSRHPNPAGARPLKYRIGIPTRQNLEYVENSYRALFSQARDRLGSLGHSLIQTDVEPFLETAKLLYGGPWVAERFAAVGNFISKHPEAVHPVVGDIILGGETFSAVDVFNGQYALETLRQKTSLTWNSVDILLLPTAPNIYRIEEVEKDPVSLNSRLGLYTNFTNLLDLAAIAVPAGFRGDGLPFGVTFLGPAFADFSLIALAKAYLRSLSPVLGATNASYPVSTPSTGGLEASPDTILVAVVGAHLTEEPLNFQLTNRSARFICESKTAPSYQLFALPGLFPPKPGLVRVGPETGRSVDLEVWELPATQFGSFMKDIPSPLTIGTVHLDSGQAVAGFLCEEVAVRSAVNISEFGGWKAYLKSLKGSLLQL